MNKEKASKQALSPNIVEIRAKLIYHCVLRIVLYVVMESGDRDRESIFWFCDYLLYWRWRPAAEMNKYPATLSTLSTPHRLTTSDSDSRSRHGLNVEQTLQTFSLPFHISNHFVNMPFSIDCKKLLNCDAQAERETNILTSEDEKDLKSNLKG